MMHSICSPQQVHEAACVDLHRQRTLEQKIYLERS